MSITLFFIISLTFFLMHAIPGGPFTSEKVLSPEVKQAILQKYHLNDPLWKQYLNYLKGIAQLDFGPSLKYPGVSVNELLTQGFPVSAKAGLWAILVVVCFGIPLGVLAALKRNQWLDHFVMFIATIGVAIPPFVLATLLLYFFALYLGWVPTFGIQKWEGYILPVASLSGYSLAFIAKLTRSSLLEVLGQDYMLTAKAKGLYQHQILFKHGLKNSMIPVITILGPLVAYLVTGSFIIEEIFALPGIGKHFVQSISNRDYTTIMGFTIFYAAFVIFMIFLVDLIYVLIDPRIQVHK